MINTIVEQSQIKKSGFTKEQIHNTSNIVAIMRVKVPLSMIDKLDTTTVDGHIFKHGTVTVRNELLDEFNKSIIEIKHYY